jgi:hypothetical protein
MRPVAQRWHGGLKQIMMVSDLEHAVKRIRAIHSKLIQQ